MFFSCGRRVAKFLRNFFVTPLPPVVNCVRFKGINPTTSKINQYIGETKQKKKRNKARVSLKEDLKKEELFGTSLKNAVAPSINLLNNYMKSD
ncbi:hypothetical protein BpHYR1_008004 [Brachionus plicatilis]|uniref:Uncharacterized protein n=1 Tax=Brachionus plicatilis TaxID=10195 RepID=A0A3M7R482_BRAPC|nr:hypothetical protein BpHYR1_008004 [Brachionus plicatilis]